MEDNVSNLGLPKFLSIIFAFYQRNGSYLHLDLYSTILHGPKASLTADSATPVLAGAVSVLKEPMRSPSPSWPLQPVKEEGQKFLKCPYLPYKKHTSSKGSNSTCCSRPLTRTWEVRGFSKSTKIAILVNYPLSWLSVLMSSLTTSPTKLLISSKIFFWYKNHDTPRKRIQANTP